MAGLAGRTYQGLVLRKLEIEQSEAFYHHIEANRTDYAETIPFVSKTYDVATMRANIERNLKRQADGVAEFYTLWAGNRMAGYFLVREKDREAMWAEIGYMIGAEWQGQGITTAICLDLIEDLFINQMMQKIVICCNDDNTASIAVGKNLGFSVEGNIRQHFVVNGKVRNMLCLGLLKEEWQRK